MKQLIVQILILSIYSTVIAQSTDSKEHNSLKSDDTTKKSWYLGDLKSVKAHGTATYKAMGELIGDRKARKKIVVAVIDSGVDIEHEDLRDNLWVNQGEIPDNGIDDDNNGFIDDVHGWNFLVDDEDRDYVMENMEATRVLRLSRDLQEVGEPYPDWLTRDVLERAAAIYNEGSQELSSLYQFAGVYIRLDSIVRTVLTDSNYTYEDVASLKTDDPAIKGAQHIFKLLSKIGLTKDDLKEMVSLTNKYKDYYLNLEYAPRKSFEQGTTLPGNNHVSGKHTGHGTHVAGIIAANNSNEIGMDGIAGSVATIMVLKAVPDGDEHDVDVARAIRYAVDNGAHIINMSFGKGISPYKEEVYSALEYAANHNVLVVHAAGNDAENTDEVANYPNDDELTEDAQLSYLCVGALAPKKGKKLVANFSNFGQESVDLFAPGEDIYSTMPGSKYDYQSGTSMAAPVVSGVAALIWAYHPQLMASEVKEILISSGIDLGKKKVLFPGTKTKVRFSELSVSGTAINTYKAFMMAQSISDEG